jgi:hypothetical protein
MRVRTTGEVADGERDYHHTKWTSRTRRYPMPEPGPDDPIPTQELDQKFGAAQLGTYDYDLNWIAP